MTDGNREDVRIISFSMPNALVSDMERLTRDMGYTNRSELIRDAIRNLIKNNLDVDKLEGKIEGVIITLYDHSAEVDVSDIRHRNMEIIKSFMHTDFNERTKTCCDVIFVSGQAKDVKELCFDLGVIKNVKEVKLFVA